MKCPKCSGRKYIELDKVGLLVTGCPECEGTGEVETPLNGDIVTVSDSMRLPGTGFLRCGCLDNGELCEHSCSYIPSKAVESIIIPKELEGVANDSDSGIRELVDFAGGSNSSQPEQPRKKRKKVSRKAK